MKSAIFDVKEYESIYGKIETIECRPKVLKFRDRLKRKKKKLNVLIALHGFFGAISIIAMVILGFWSGVSLFGVGCMFEYLFNEWM